MLIISGGDDKDDNDNYTTLTINIGRRNDYAMVDDNDEGVDYIVVVYDDDNDNDDDDEDHDDDYDDDALADGTIACLQLHSNPIFPAVHKIFTGDDDDDDDW